MRSALAFSFFRDGVALEVFEGDEFEGGDVGGGEVDGGGEARIEGFLPWGDSEAPFVSGLEAGEVVIRHGRGKVVAAGAAEGEEFGGGFDADGVEAVVAGAGAAVAVAVKAGHGREAAGEEFSAQDVGADGFGHEWRLPTVTDRRYRNPLICLARGAARAG